MRPLRCLTLLLPSLGLMLMLMLVLTSPLAHAQVTGKSILLVASLKMKDPRFERTVILVTRHGRSPPLGVIINRPLDTALGTLFPAIPATEAKRPLFFGGPVSSNLIAFLFRSKTGSKDAIAVTGEVHLGRSGTVLDELLNGSRSHRGLRVFAGYSGWSEGQLEHEIHAGSWHVLPIDEEMLFDKSIELIWPELIRRATQQTAQAPSSINAFSPDT
jgi:putative transcriptional regulator